MFTVLRCYRKQTFDWNLKKSSKRTSGKNDTVLMKANFSKTIDRRDYKQYLGGYSWSHNQLAIEPKLLALNKASFYQKKKEKSNTKYAFSNLSIVLCYPCGNNILNKQISRRMENSYVPTPLICLNQPFLPFSKQISAAVRLSMGIYVQ